MDIASLLGLGGGIGVVLFGIIQSAGAGGISYFIDIPSIIITVGGSLMALASSRKMPDLIGGFKSLKLAIKEPSIPSPQATIQQIIDMSNVARKEGLLALEGYTENIDDEFMKKGIMLVVDGTDADLVRSILETDLTNMDDRHKSVAGFWDFWSTMCPAWGMIGTLIGLVIMLQNMSDPSSIVPSMAVALITTFYGSLIANWICVPTCEKLKLNNANELSVKSIMIEGILSIQAGENPHVIEEKLKTFLAPSLRASIGEQEGEGGGG